MLSFFSKRLLGLVLLSSFVFVAMSANDPLTKNKSVDLKSLAEETGGEYLTSSDGISFMSREGDERLYALLDSDNEKLKRAFVVQSKELVNALNVSFDSYEAVFYNGNALIHAKKGNKSQLFSLGLSAELEAKLGGVSPDMTYIGYGFADLNGSWSSADYINRFNDKSLTLEELLIETSDLSDDDKVEAYKRFRACHGGGPGSTGCSASGLGWSCSVTCGSGYYSCCNALGCSCIAVKKDEN